MLPIHHYHQYHSASEQATTNFVENDQIDFIIDWLCYLFIIIIIIIAAEQATTNVLQSLRSWAKEVIDYGFKSLSVSPQQNVECIPIIKAYLKTAPTHV